MKRILLHIIFLSMTMLSGIFAAGQPPVPKLKFKRISIEQGLSNSTVEIIFQDKRGFIWIGTRDGLNRFDGKQMKVFRFNPADSSSISDNFIKVIYQDQEGILWVGTINGLNRFDPTTNSFVRYKQDSAKPGSLSHNFVTHVFEDRQKKLWIATWGGGLNQVSADRRSFTRFTYNSNNPRSVSSNYVSYLFEDARGTFWVATKNGLNQFNRELSLFRSLNNLPVFAKSTAARNIRMVSENRTGQLLLATEEAGLLLFNPVDSSIRDFRHFDKDAASLATNQVRAVLVDRNWNTWVGGVNGGLDLLDPEANGFYHYQNEPENLSSLSQRTVSALFEDRQGNLWVGTHRGGINLYTPNAEKFALFQQQLTGNSLSYNDVRAFCEDGNGKIWIGTDGGGLNLFDRTTRSFRSFRSDPFNPRSLGSNEVLDILQDSQKKIWLATWGGGLNLFDPVTQSFTRYTNNPADPSSISSNYVQQVLEDSKGTLWVATYYGGLNKMERSTGKFTRITTDPAGRTSLSGNNIISLNEDKQGNLWIGTDDGGLNCLKASSNSFVHYFNNAEKSPDLRVLFTDSKGGTWVGHAGLFKFNPATNTFEETGIKAGLPTEFIKGMAEDEQGNLWISTSNGVTRLNPADGIFKKYNTADGLQGLEFEANAYMKTRDGEIYFGGVNGFNSFYPENIRQNTFKPPVYLTAMLLFNKEIHPGGDSPLGADISLTRSLKLDHRQSTFSFEFAALNYTALENNQYAYKLEGWDDDWQYSGANSKASYTNIPPGHYTFRVRASNNDGLWNDDGPSLAIEITPPFYSTLWFRILMIAGSIAALIAYFQYKRRSEIRVLKEEKKEEIHQLQLQFFTNISHEFRTPLSLIIGPLEKMQREDDRKANSNYYSVMLRNANRLMNLITELMDFRKAETGVLKLNVMPGNLDLFVTEVAAEFSELAKEKNIRFNVNIDSTIPNAWFDRQVLEKIMINLIGNSFKYTGNHGAISVSLLESLERHNPPFSNSLQVKNEFAGKRYVYVAVTDNGIGISKESIPRLFERYYKITDTHLGSGIGLAFVKSLAKLHKAGITVYSERNKGTEIILAIPVHPDDYTSGEKWVSNKTAEVNLESISLKETGQDPTAEVGGQAAPAENLSPHILIVDDNEELLTFLEESLGTGYIISKAVDGAAGLVTAREEIPDIIISDVMMPNMDGIDFCRAVKEDPDLSHIPFIMLTARDAIESRIRGTHSGADHYFSKPVSMELLLTTVKNIIYQRAKLRARYVNDHYADAKELAHSSRDKEFMDRLISVIEEHLSNPEMDVDYICSGIGMSKTRLYQKIKKITGQSIGEFIRTVRFKKAAKLMTEEDMPLSEVMYSVGVQTQSYFTKAFKNEFGKTPTQFLKDLKK
ncbi:MAG: hybrid sensor histidine kinase/response regulator [Chitinophagaceae bacterium]|nr:MAG: hybrid sensor histidine kinase/response regulator [Chitinophagaceae bacterium]